MMRSTLLTHWTGKNIEKHTEKLNDDSRDKYMKRLKSILKDGIWMRRNEEEVHGWHDKEPITVLKTQAPMVCFTELRLTQSHNHYNRYGLLGIVVDREFVLRRHGAPVFYVPSRTDETIVGNLRQMLEWIKHQAEQNTPGATTLLENVFVPISYLKAMSNTDKNDFENLNENEWRIVHTNKRQEEGLIISTGQDDPAYTIPVLPSDLRMLVLPDSKMRNKILKDEFIQEWFEHNFPPMLTIEEIGEI